MTTLQPLSVLPVQRLWALYEARRWDEAVGLFTPEACCTWWATRERFVGAEAIVRVNAIYPEGWRLHLLEINPMADGRVHSLVRVDHGEHSFYANSFFQTDGERIAAVDEYWSDVSPPPAWRAPAAALPGQQHLSPDQRQGMAWTL